MAITRRLFVANLVIIGVAGCASMPSDFEQPSLEFTSIMFRNSGSVAPQFDILLHVTNPNRIPLDLQGMSYTVSLAGHRMVTGVSNDLPIVPAYGEADVRISAVVSLFGTIRLLNDLMTRNPDRVEYEFDARMDVGRSRPRLHIRDSGVISLAAPN